MEVPSRLSRVARMRQRVQARKRARARRAALAAGAVGIVVIVGMLATAFTTPSSTRAMAADRVTDSTPSTETSTSSASTSASVNGAAAAAAPPVAAVSSASSAAAPGSVTPEPTSSTSTSTTADSAAAAGPGSTIDSSTQPASSPTGKSFGGTPVAGVLYQPDSGVSSHFCSASVVHSSAGNLVITAAHCVYGNGPKSDMAFAPGFHDGQLPYGSWTVTKVVVSDNWQNSEDPDEDVAFLQVAPNSKGASLESVTGADRIAFNQGFGMPVTVPAYPQGSDSPITCVAPAVKFSSAQTEWDCRGYPDGTSGAPFLEDVDSSGEKGTVIGVIGGYEQGGNTPDVSYSAYFGSAIQTLYQNASS